MIGKSVCLLAVCAACLVTPALGSLASVDPNTLSCDPRGQVFLLLPHFTECNKYYMCAHGQEVEFICPGPLIFDFKLQTCNWDWATSCTLRTPKGEEDIEGSGSGSGDDEIYELYGRKNDMPIAMLKSEDETVSADAHQFNAIISCNQADSASKQLPYKGDCQRYWKCIGGVPQTVYCTDGLFFNEKTEQCDFEANTWCQSDVADELKGEYIVY